MCPLLARVRVVNGRPTLRERLDPVLDVESPVDDAFYEGSNSIRTALGDVAISVSIEVSDLDQTQPSCLQPQIDVDDPDRDGLEESFVVAHRLPDGQADVCWRAVADVVSDAWVFGTIEKVARALLSRQLEYCAGGQRLEG